MGGNAFKTALPDARFPRIAPSIYDKLKARLLLQLQAIYEYVAVPHEAPGKADYGDIDFVVCKPHVGLRHEDVRAALGAAQSISFDNNYHSNFALQATDHDSSLILDTYYQVDVQVCDTLEEWDRVVFFTSYGDVGMILGLIARPHGIVVGRSGIKLANPLPTLPPVTLHLSQSVRLIMEFLGLSMDRWKQGFFAEEDIFLWLASSRFYNPHRMLRHEESLSRGKIKAAEDRPMYQRFLNFSRSQAIATTRRIDPGNVPSDAVDFFGKRALYTVLLRVAEIKSHVKTNFTGVLVTKWTGLEGMLVHLTMKEVRQQLGGDELLTMVSGIPLDSLPVGDVNTVHLTLRVWESTMYGLSADEIKQMAVRVKGELEAEGKLKYDWRAAKQKKAEGTEQKQVQS